MTEPLADPLAPLRPFLTRDDPFPLAWMLKTRVLGQTDPEKQASALIDFARAVVRYAALVVASDYANRPIVEATVSKALEGLARPKESTFSELLRIAVPELAARDALFVPELVASFDRAWSEQVSALQIGEHGLELASPQPLLVALVQTRNDSVHQRFAGVWPRFVAHTAPLVAKLLDAFPWFGRYGLMRLVDGDRWIRLAGSAPVFDAVPIPSGSRAALAGLAPADRPSGLWLVSPDGARLLPLDPFVVWAECPLCPQDPVLGLGDEVFVFNGDQGRSLVYVGMVHPRRLSAPWARATEIFRAKHVDEPPLHVSRLTVPELCARAERHSAIGLDENIAAQRYLPRLYQPRAEMEDELERYLTGPRAAFLLLGEAGSGKTSLLCHQVETWAARGEVVLLYRGHQLRPDGPLEDRLLRDLHLAGSGPELTSFLARRGSRLVIVVDGVNECADPPALLRELCAFAARAAAAAGADPPAIKLLLSVRSPSFARALAGLLAAGGDEGLLFPAGVFHQDARRDAQPAPPAGAFIGGPAEKAYRIELGCLRPEEVARLYEGYRAAPEDPPAATGPSRRRRPLTPFVELSPAVREVLAHPWYLRLVLEAYDGQPVPPDVWGGALVEQFCLARLTGRTPEEAARFAGRAALLDELVALMRRQRVATFLRDDLHDLSPRWSQALLGAELARSPYLQLVDEGVLMEVAEADVTGQWPRTRHAVRVAFDVLLDHLLADAVLREVGGAAQLTAATLTACLEESRRFEPMAGAFEVLLTGAARAARTDLLRATFDAAPQDLAAPVFQRVTEALAPARGEPFEALLLALGGAAGGAGRPVLNAVAVTLLDARRLLPAIECTRTVILATPGSEFTGAGIVSERGRWVPRITPAAPRKGDVATMHELAVALSNQGTAETGLGEPQLATSSYQQAFRLFIRLVEEERRSEYLGHLASIIMQCGNNLVDLGQLNEALVLLENAVGYAKRAMNASKSFEDVRTLALAALNRGLLLERLGQHARAAEDCELAARMMRVGVDGGVPGDWARLLGAALIGHSRALASLGRLPEALAVAEEAVAIQRRRVAAEGGTAGAEDLANALRTLSLHLDGAGRPAEGLPVIEEAIEILRRLVAAGRRELTIELARCYGRQGALFERLGRRADAEAAKHTAAQWNMS